MSGAGRVTREELDERIARFALQYDRHQREWEDLSDGERRERISAVDIELGHWLDRLFSQISGERVGWIPEWELKSKAAIPVVRRSHFVFKEGERLVELRAFPLSAGARGETP